MVGTITTTVGGGRSLPAGLVFLGANVVVSATVGAALGLFGAALPHQPVVIASALVCSACVFAFVVRGRLPYFAWPPQLPSRWLDPRHPIRTAGRYAVVWGLAFVTPIRAGSLIVLGLLCVYWAHPLAAGALFAIVGLIRAFPAAMRSVLPPAEELHARARLAATWQRPAIGLADALALTAVLVVITQTFVV